jgi:hypothetical protein
MSNGHCTKCGAILAGRFCAQCGAPADGGPVIPGRRGAKWAVAGFAILAAVTLVVLVLRHPTTPPAVPEAAEAASGSTPGRPPDISGLSPRQRFDTLYNLVMRASESGDAARAARFAPMAQMAYEQLEDVDADARYHAAVLHLHVGGEVKPALLLADTIQATAPGHLFAFMIRGMVGQFARDDSMVRKAARDFLAAWDREIASGKPEYQDHRIMLDQFRERALKAGSVGKP